MADARKPGGRPLGNQVFLRQLIMDEIGIAGQARLRGACVAVAGLGGLGGPAAEYLLRAGIGGLVLADCDLVDETNLNRQILYSAGDVGKKKTVAAARRLASIGIECRVSRVDMTLTAENAAAFVSGCDLAIDCLDNFEARLGLAAVCWRQGIPLVHGACRGLEGRVSVQAPGRAPCLACFFRDDAAQTRPVPVLGATAGAIGSMQAAEAVKLLCGHGSALEGRVLMVDLMAGEFRRLSIGRRADCPVCGDAGVGQ